MKILGIALLVIAIALVAGCTTAPQQQAPAAPQGTPVLAPPPGQPAAIPNLTGTWTGTMQAYEEGTGFTDYGGSSMSMVVTEQRGRLFAGHFIFAINATRQEVTMAGIIGRDGSTLSLVENANGYTFGVLTAPDTIELTHLDDKEAKFGVAIDTLKREK
jgi:hypothetical protein